MTYDFTRFSTQSFERFIQALSADLLGTKVQIFGAGKDGAREATYSGKSTLSSTGLEWNGYTVIQAKYHEISESPQRNERWIISEIDKELSKFSDTKRALRTPEYYVLATNVRLSASAADASGKFGGGIDKVEKHLRKKCDELGINDFALWHADTLSAFLDTRESIRTSFQFWVSPSDVLSALLKKLSLREKDDVLNQYIVECIKSARDIKTRDMGRSANTNIRIEEIFVDLPVETRKQLIPQYNSEVGIKTEDEQVLDPKYEDDDIDLEDIIESDAQRCAVSRLAIKAADKFDLHVWAEESDDESCENEPVPNRIVLLGGPGQGKSTVGQFLSQLCRARLLEKNLNSQSPEVKDCVKNIISCAKEQHIKLTGPYRYPLHIELPRFADKLAASPGNLSIVGYISDHIKFTTDIDVNYDEVRSWISQIPTILILDGLDEVPHSGNRKQVIQAISSFVDWIHTSNSDSLIFITSRPQGYRDEFSRKNWEHWTLDSLNSTQAMEIVEKIAPVLVSDKSRLLDVCSTLDQTSKSEFTASLMTSPLQIMLLLNLVITHSNIPKDRWTLFSRSYETLRDREIAKGGRRGEIIGRLKGQIDRIHHDAGFLLHVRAEGAGGAAAFFTLSEFSNLVRRTLEKDGFDDEEIDELSQEVTEIATNRLVFLRCLTDKQVTFDVRSLQEFMAAARLISSPEARIIERLEEIAGKAHWLHVFKIACSKIFGSNGHESIREPVIGLIDSLDRGDRSIDDMLVKTGSKLALQLLSDGATNNLPVYKKKIANRCLNLLGSNDLISILNLSRSTDLSLKSTIEPFLYNNMSRDKNTFSDYLKYSILSSNFSQGSDDAWMQKAASLYLEESGTSFSSILTSAYLLPSDPVLTSKFKQMQWSNDAKYTFDFVTDINVVDEEDDEILRKSVVFRGSSETNIVKFKNSSNDNTEVSIRFIGIDGNIRLDPIPESAHSSWYVWSAISKFVNAPTKEAAADFLVAMANSDSPLDLNSGYMPWVLHELSHDTSDAQTLLDRAEEVLAGKLGDTSTWRNAEARWHSSGIRHEELHALNYSNLKDVDTFGAPTSASISIRADVKHITIENFIRASERIGNNEYYTDVILRMLNRIDNLNDNEISFLNNTYQSIVSGNLSKAKYRFLPVIVSHWRQLSKQMDVKEIALNLLPMKHKFYSTREGFSSFLEDVFKPGFNREFLPIVAVQLSRSQRIDRDLMGSLPFDAFFSKVGDSPAVAESVAALQIMSGGDHLKPFEAVKSLNGSYLSILMKTFRSMMNGHDTKIPPDKVLELARSTINLVNAPMHSARNYISTTVESLPTKFLDEKLCSKLDLPIWPAGK